MILIIKKKYILDIMHCFELKTSTVDYYVGEDPTYGDNNGQVPAPESGIGVHVARSWETNIRQALMPVTTASTSMYKILLFLFYLHEK